MTARRLAESALTAYAAVVPVAGLVVIAAGLLGVLADCLGCR